MCPLPPPTPTPTPPLRARAGCPVFPSCAGDRRVRLRAPSSINCTAYAVRSQMGPLVFAGSDAAEVLVFELLTCSFFKALGTASGVEAASGDIVTALAVHPSMCTVDGSGADVVYVGHCDGSVVGVNLSSGAVVAEFARPEDPLDVSSPRCVSICRACACVRVRVCVRARARACGRVFARRSTKEPTFCGRSRGVFSR